MSIMPHPVCRWWGQFYSDTKFTMVLAGHQNSLLRVTAFDCPAGGCSDVPAEAVDVRTGTLLWSNKAIWPSGVKPREGDDVGARLALGIWGQGKHLCTRTALRLQRTRAAVGD